MKYSIIIPCYNEKENIPSLVERIRPLVDKYDVEFILIENGSTDGSREVFKEMNIPWIKTVYVDKNQGYGFGIKEGIKSAKGRYIGWIHADMQIPPEQLSRFFDYIEKNEPNRGTLLKGSRINRKPSEEFFTVGQGVVSTLVFGRLMRDVSAVPILVSKEFFVENDLDIIPNDFAIDIYIYYYALKLGYKLKRIVVEYAEREHGSSSWSKGLKSKLRQSKRIVEDSFMIKKGQIIR